jgi:hypothetical protein
MTSREQALAILKDLVSTLKSKGKELKDNKARADVVIRQNQKLTTLMESLSAEDKQWVSDQYEAWFKEFRGGIS